MDELRQQINLLIQQTNLLKREWEDIRYLLNKKTGGGPADIKGKIVQPSNVTATVAADSIGQAELDTETVAVTVTAGNPSGTGTVTSGSIILGWRPTGNNDQFVDNITVSGTTLTITLATNATVDNTFSVILLKV